MTNTNRQLQDLRGLIEPTLRALRAHSLYNNLRGIDALRIFMQHHVFAVWDFMSLIKCLQSHMTCTTLPWIPTRDTAARRLINEIVLDEESDDLVGYGYQSHFELYRRAMDQAGADCTAIDRFIALLSNGENVERALLRAGAPFAAIEFVLSLFKTLETTKAHGIAAAFTLGREEPIPGMFRRIIQSAEQHPGADLSVFSAYLDRHIDLDENRHAPMSERMLCNLCGDSADAWLDSGRAALDALRARLDLWDAIDSEIRLSNSDDSRGLAVTSSINITDKIFSQGPELPSR